MRALAGDCTLLYTVFMSGVEILRALNTIAIIIKVIDVTTKVLEWIGDSRLKKSHGTKDETRKWLV